MRSLHIVLTALVFGEASAHSGATGSAGSLSASFVLKHEGGECGSSDSHLGYFDSLQKCAEVRRESWRERAVCPLPAPESLPTSACCSCAGLHT